MRSGLEKIRSGGGYSGTIPFQQALGYVLMSADPGRVSYRLPPTAVARDLLATGSVFGGIATLVDAACCGAAITMLPGDAVATTRLLEVSLLTPPELDEPLDAHAAVDGLGERTAVARTVVCGRDGRPVAVGTVNMFVLRGSSSIRVSVPNPTATPPSFDVARDVRVRAAEGEASLEVLPVRGLANSLGTLHGGATAIMLDLAASRVERSIGEAESPSRVGLSVSYLRPTPLDQPFRVAAQVEHRGATVVLSEAEIRDARGRITAQARSTSLR